MNEYELWMYLRLCLLREKYTVRKKVMYEGEREAVPGEPLCFTGDGKVARLCDTQNEGKGKKE